MAPLALGDLLIGPMGRCPRLVLNGPLALTRPTFSHWVVERIHRAPCGGAQPTRIPLKSRPCRPGALTGRVFQQAAILKRSRGGDDGGGLTFPSPSPRPSPPRRG